MQSRFISYSNRIIRLPKGLALLVFIMLLLLIPIILSLLIAGGILTMLTKSITGALPKRKEKIEYTEYEVIEENSDRRK